MYIYIYIHIHVYVCIYTHTYMHTLLASYMFWDMFGTCLGHAWDRFLTAFNIFLRFSDAFLSVRRSFYLSARDQGG